MQTDSEQFYWDGKIQCTGLLGRRNTVLYGKKSRIFGQIFGIGFFLGRVSRDFWGILAVVFGGLLEAF